MDKQDSNQTPVLNALRKLTPIQRRAVIGSVHIGGKVELLLAK